MVHRTSSDFWVRSTAGSDRGTLYWVLRRESNIIWLVDGKRHRLTNPKKKNPKHIQVAEWPKSALPTLPAGDDLTASRAEQLKWEAILRRTRRILETKE